MFKPLTEVSREGLIEYLQRDNGTIYVLNNGEIVQRLRYLGEDKYEATFYRVNSENPTVETVSGLDITKPGGLLLDNDRFITPSGMVNLLNYWDERDANPSSK